MEKETGAMKENKIETQDVMEEIILRHILRSTWKAEKEKSESGVLYYCYPTHILMEDDIETLKRMLIRLGEGDVIKERRKYTRKGNVINMIR